jgi:GNAT superfamily N-acetyltransferase
MQFRQWINEDTSGIAQLVANLEAQYPGLDLFAWENERKIELSDIKVPPEQQGQGIGSAVIKAIQQYAVKVDKPIVLSPSPQPRKKKKLLDFYKRHGFVLNKGRNKDYTLSSTFATTMYWRPRFLVSSS